MKMTKTFRLGYSMAMMNRFPSKDIMSFLNHIKPRMLFEDFIESQYVTVSTATFEYLHENLCYKIFKIQCFTSTTLGQEQSI